MELIPPKRWLVVKSSMLSLSSVNPVGESHREVANKAGHHQGFIPKAPQSNDCRSFFLPIMGDPGVAMIGYITYIHKKWLGNSLSCVLLTFIIELFQFIDNVVS